MELLFEGARIGHIVRHANSAEVCHLCGERTDMMYGLLIEDPRTRRKVSRMRTCSSCIHQGGDYKGLIHEAQVTVVGAPDEFSGLVPIEVMNDDPES